MQCVLCVCTVYSIQKDVYMYGHIISVLSIIMMCIVYMYMYNVYVYYYSYVCAR